MRKKRCHYKAGGGVVVVKKEERKERKKKERSYSLVRKEDLKKGREVQTWIHQLCRVLLLRKRGDFLRTFN